MKGVKGKLTGMQRKEAIKLYRSGEITIESVIDEYEYYTDEIYYEDVIRESVDESLSIFGVEIGDLMTESEMSDEEFEELCNLFDEV